MKHLSICGCEACTGRRSRAARMSAQSARLSRAIQEVERARREHHRCLDVRDLITAGILKPDGHTDRTYVQASEALRVAEEEALRLHALAVEHGQVLVGGTLAEPHATCGPYARFDSVSSNWIGVRAGSSSPACPSTSPSARTTPTGATERP